MQPFIEIINVSKSYSDYKALNNVSFNVPKQSIFGLLGPNGAGKTTLIRILNQITAPDEGRIMFDGTPLSQRHVSMIGYLPEERGLYKKMKVGEQAVYLAQLKGLDAKTAEKRLKYWFGKFEIGSWWNKKVEELSKGMQQKIQFIVTVIHEPKLLIFDEPFSGFDPINVNLLKNEILDMRDKGATILFSTHNMASVEELCDNIMLINKGKMLLEGGVTEIKQQFKNNIFELTMQNVSEEVHLPECYNIMSCEKKQNGMTHLKIQADKNIDSNELVTSILKKGRLVSFQELLPSINDIFIKQINDKNNSQI
ncbi:MAG TPA: ATP-binding cassette domain-containing protein [Bacteroidetes bacterium]|nr:ATP-binding cassette domain-containing protein [Candidatus Limimorpha avicola]